ncbi:MAG: outer-membrane lipoprotein carrier protein LolA [Candidatus Margulisiibacteriota bacterium]
MSNKFVLAFLISILLALPCQAQKSAVEIASGISANLKKIIDFKANVEISLTSDNIEERSSGMIFFKAPDKYRVELFFPKKQLIVANGSTLVIQDPVSSKQIKQNLSRLSEKETLALPFIPDINRYFDLFNFSVQAQSSASILLKGDPRDKSRNIGRIDVYCDPKNSTPTRIVSYNKKGSLVSLREISYIKIGESVVPARSYAMAILPAGNIQADIEYKNIKINTNIPDSQFRIN